MTAKQTLFYTLLFLGLATLLWGCSPAQLQGVSTDVPQLAPTTQKVEIVLQGGDKVATTATTIGQETTTLGQTGQALGIPYSDWAIIAGGVITGLAGLWRKARGDATDATSAAVTIAKASHDESPIGLTPAVASAIANVAAFAPEVTSEINKALPAATSGVVKTA